MPAMKRGVKRKIVEPNGAYSNGSSALTVPDRATWRGWVEIESEPAFFNVMLKEMGVRGIKVQEVYSLDEEMLAVLPQPVHALIFLFRYRTTDAHNEVQTTPEGEIWFANQVPDFACASIALLNIVNNITDLDVGDQLEAFQRLTRNMDPIARGVAVENFDFLRRIHNSFARDTDLLQADMYTRDKLRRAKKKLAVAKGQETRAANKAKDASKDEAMVDRDESEASQNPGSDPSGMEIEDGLDEQLYGQDSAKQEDIANSADEDNDFVSRNKSSTAATNDAAQEPRRSKRSRKLSVKGREAQMAEESADQDEDGFHFIAYMPINNHVWKLDGLDRHPQCLDSRPDEDSTKGSCTSHWLDVVRPTIQARMMQFQGADIEFNIMAVVHDSTVSEKYALLQNIRSLQSVEAKLTDLVEDWRCLEGAELTDGIIAGPEPALDLSQAELDAVTPTLEAKCALAETDTLIDLVELRRHILQKQAPLRANLRDSLRAAKNDEESAAGHRVDHTAFIRSWVSALAEGAFLDDLLGEDQ